MKKRISVLLTFLLFAFILFIPNVKAQKVSPTPAVTSTPTFQNSSNAMPTSTQERTNPFNYTPLPTNNGGLENDIIEVQPLTVSRNTVQVDDSINLSVTIQNRASYNKTLQNVCFESTDGNFGCAWGISLSPGQTDTINNVGTWTSGGVKDIWITWSQDGLNYYEPINATHVEVTVLY